MAGDEAPKPIDHEAVAQSSPSAEEAPPAPASPPANAAPAAAAEPAPAAAPTPKAAEKPAAAGSAPASPEKASNEQLKILFFNPTASPLWFQVGNGEKFRVNSKAFTTQAAKADDSIKGYQGMQEEIAYEMTVAADLDHEVVRIATLPLENSEMASRALALGRTLAEMERISERPVGAVSEGKGAGSPMGNTKGKLSRSTPALGSYQDLKEKTAFSGATTNGVLNRQTYMTQFSNFRHSPKYSIGVRGPNVFIRSSGAPAPGTYSLPPEEKSKYKTSPKFSFGSVSRFGLGEFPGKKSPGPGAYNPADPSLSSDVKVGFGTAVRGRGSLLAQQNPGPGAYEFKSCMGQGRMCTAAGRHTTSFMRARSLPGPGAYNPSYNATGGSAPKCGFGTSTRDDIGGKARNLSQPGPGAYEMQNVMSVGCDAPKYSATSRRRVHDLNSYMTPGPGAYNAHVTSFGY